jgi:hypothetical protein
MLDRPRPALTARAAPQASVGALLVGQTAEAAAALLPGLFNLCRAAQVIAGRRALGLAVPPGAQDALAAEIRRDHLLKLFISWPGQLGLPALPLPAGWMEGGAALRTAVFGPAAAPPRNGADLQDFLASGHGAAPVLAAIGRAFAPGEAAADGLRAPTAATAFARAACENSVAARHARHPALRHIAARHGRGPLWRAAARFYDIAATLDGTLPAPLTPRPGRALVAAARGLYAVEARVADGRVTAFARITPTDHLLAPGGILDRALATLPPARAALLLDILDPCAPVTLTGAPDA